MSTKRIMTIFLFNIREYVDQTTMSNFEAFFENLYSFINKHYYEILRSYADEAGIKTNNLGIYINPDK